MALSDLAGKMAANSRFWVVLAVASIAVVAVFQLFRVDNPLTIEEMLPAELPPISELKTEANSRFSPVIDSLLASGIAVDSLAASGTFHGDSLALSAYFFREGVRRYNNRSYSDAESFFGLSFRFSPAGTTPHEHQLWFSALSHAQNGNLEEALLRTLQVYQLTGDYQDEAFILAKKILFETGITNEELQNLQPSSL